MASLPTYFRDFLAAIRPTENQSKDMRTGHSTLRNRLSSFEALQPICVCDFLQGSYRRSTAIRPANEIRSDVDIVVVTKLKREDYRDPQDAMEIFRPFVDKYYEGKYEFKGRAIGIELSYVELDLVITSAPSEADQKALRWAAVRSSDTPEEVSDWRFNEYWVSLNERKQLGSHSRLLQAAKEEQWKSEPLWIPNRDAGEWQQTHPLAQIAWTFEKNRLTNGQFVNVVKAIKWWRRIKHPTPKHPKGYPLEHIIGDCCPDDDVESVAHGIVHTLEEIRERFAEDANQKITPCLPDRGVDQNVLDRISGEDFAEFHSQVAAAAKLARSAYEEDDTAKSANLWIDLFGDKFPAPPSKPGDDGGSGSMKAGGFSERLAPSVPPRSRFG